MNTESVLHIRKFSLEYRGEGSDAERVGKKLESLVQDGLSDNLQECLRPLDQSRDLVVFIKKIELEFDLDLALSNTQILDFWARSLQNSLLKNIRDSGNSKVAVFASQQSYHAQFIRDLLGGRFGSQWYYQKFEGLRALPLSAALRTLLIHYPLVAPALDGFTRTELATLCTALSANDCKILCEHFGLTSDASATVKTSVSLKKVAVDLVAMFDEVNVSDLPQARLLCYLEMRNDDARLSAVQKILPLIYTLKQWRDRLSSPQFSRLLLSLVNKERCELLKLSGRSGVENLLYAFRYASPDLREILAAFAPRAPVGSRFAPAATRFSYFGNALFLLAHLTQIPLRQWTEHWPEFRGLRAEVMLRHLALSLCQGPERFAAAFKDPVLQSLAGVPVSSMPLCMADICDWLRALKPEDSEKLGEAYRGWMCEQVEDTVDLNCRVGDRVCAMSVEQKKNICLCFEYRSTETDFSVDSDSTADSIAVSDMRFFLGNDDIVLPENIAPLIYMLSQYALRSFAYRLPGFSQSSLLYLLRNFLGMSLTLVEEEERFVAHLSRVPMSIILNMTGINRGSLRLEDFDARIIVLQEAMA